VHQREGRAGDIVPAAERGGQIAGKRRLARAEPAGERDNITGVKFLRDLLRGFCGIRFGMG
jgi:hypothetical protein